MPVFAFPQHSAGHIDCPVCKLSRDTMIEPAALARLPFMNAARIWLDGHKLTIAPASIEEYEKNLKRLEVFFGSLTLSEIHIGHIEQYQKLRSDGVGWSKKAGASRINHELNTVSQILTRAGLWGLIAPYYKPLPMPKSTPGRAMSEEQEETLFCKASSKPRWKVAYLCSIITANTTAGPGEIRWLRLRDIELAPTPSLPWGKFTVREGAKNNYRIRAIPLNESAAKAMLELVERANRLGALAPDHFLLPRRAYEKYGTSDPTRPMSSWKKAWDKLRKAAGMPTLRMYDLRHHTITKLLEDENISERTVIELAGHISKKMLDTYSHIRLKSKLEGVMALERKPVKKAQVAVGFGAFVYRSKM